MLVYQHPDDEIAYGVLTGDDLFIGDVGRPGLLASIGVSADELGHQLYGSIQRTPMGLPDAVRVFPAHAGERADSVALVTAGQPSAPEYFVHDAILNRKERAVYDADQPLAALDATQRCAAVADGAVVHDARDRPGLRNRSHDRRAGRARRWAVGRNRRHGAPAG